MGRACALALASAPSCTNDGDGGGPAGNAGNAGTANGRCWQGTFSVASRANGTGFPHPDGTAVTATIGLANPHTVSTTVEGGGFSISLYEDNRTCNLGGTTSVPVALYIDTNADGACTIAEDVVIVWTATGGAWGPSSPGNDVELSPATGSCASSFAISYYHSGVDRVRDVARRLCPEIQDCLPFCRPPDPPGETLPDRYGGFCGRDPGTPDAGVP